MSNLWVAFWAENMKVRKSKMIWVTFAAFTVAPLMAGFFMFILKNSDLAESSGLVGGKAQILGEANWPAYFSMLAQIIAVGGILVFGFVTSWVFGREYTDRTLKDLLALPYRRTTIAAAKFFTVFATALLLSIHVAIVGTLLGFLIGLPGWSTSGLIDGLIVLLVTTLLTIALSTPAAFVACWGEGYLAPLGFVIFMVVVAQVVAAIGYGQYFPWAVPALFSGIAGEEPTLLWSSLLLVLLTSMAWVGATFSRWIWADHQ
ncbi:ABC-2 type transport system permease protein [Planomicrobium sp. HSC-17F08]|nr:ABC-2 type transport system permease protein [Planomicrobium sp. HSC-17F08]